MNILRIIGRKPVVQEIIPKLRKTSFHVTLWPAFPHFPRFANDPRLQGIRLNSAMMAASEIDGEFVRQSKATSVPLWFDIKGMQMRIKEVVCDHTQDHLEFILNRPVKCKTPCNVYFKGGEDCGRCIEIRNGTHFIFKGGPQFEVRAGESIHILDPNLVVGGPLLLGYELEKIEKIKSLGLTRWYLSYVYSQRHVDEFREMIGKNAELILKVENQAALDYVVKEYRPMPNTNLMAARGDLFVEVNQPHEILAALKLIIEKAKDAFVGSRMLLSLVKSNVPSCADLCELAWLYDIGYRNFLLCDELCLKEPMLGAAISVFEAFKDDYCETNLR